jgi:hypothetical protein
MTPEDLEELEALSVARLQIQILDHDPIELGHITAEGWRAAVPDNTGPQCKEAVYQLMVQCAEKWKT